MMNREEFEAMAHDLKPHLNAICHVLQKYNYKYFPNIDLNASGFVAMKFFGEDLWLHRYRDYDDFDIQERFVEDGEDGD